MEDNDKDDNNNDKDISALGLDRDMGFSRGHQGRQGHRPHDDDDDEEEDNEVEDNDKDDDNVDNKLLRCRIVGSERVVLIPRITFIPKPREYPCEWQRRQFPVRPAFATTINKSQGQSLKNVGVWLRGEVFGHGQLYVACSRVSSPDHLKFALICDPNQKNSTTKNIVFHEVLLS